MRKRMNKKGQATGLNFFVILILAVAAVVLIILGYYKWFAPISDLPGALPTTLAVRSQACKLSSDQKIITDYCEFKEFTITKKKQYVNCDYIKDNWDTSFNDTTLACTDDVAKNHCNQLKIADATGYGKEIVNGKKCSDLLEENSATSGNSVPNVLGVASA